MPSPACFQTVHKKAGNAAENNAAGGKIQPIRLLPPEQQAQQNHKDRRRVLQYNGVGGSGQLIGQRVQRVGAADTDGSQRDPAVEAKGMMRQTQKQTNHQHGQDVPPAVDAHGVPRDYFDTQTADAVEYCGVEYKPRSPPAEPFRLRYAVH